VLGSIIRGLVTGGLASVGWAGCGWGAVQAPPEPGGSGGAAQAGSQGSAEVQLARLDVGAPHSASLDAAGNLWLLDGPRLGVLSAGASQPRWFEGPGRLGRGALGAQVCGARGGSAVVRYAAVEAQEAERFELGPGATLHALPAKGAVKDCQPGCAPEQVQGLPDAARATRCVRDPGGATWVGTRSHGLWRRDGDRWNEVKSLPGRWVRELSAGEAQLVILTERGVFTAWYAPPPRT
jgi:hypothetical protein